MSYLGSWKIDDNLTFVANTHRFDTGAATDADSAPSYYVYEDETTTALLSGSMAKLDDTNTTGFYSEQIALTAANGFEKGKSYSIYISATVNSITGTTNHTFQIEAEVDANTVSPTVNADVVSISGDSTAANNLELDYDGTGYDKSNSTIGTCTTNTDMRGTDNALLAASVNVSAGVVESNVKQLDGSAVQQTGGHIHALDDAGAAIATAANLATAQSDLDTLTGADGATLATSQPNYAPATASALSAHDSKLDTAQSDLDKLTGADGATLATSQPNYAPAKAGDNMNLADDAITSAKFDELTAYPLGRADSGINLIARTGADADTLETLSDQLDGIGSGTSATTIANRVWDGTVATRLLTGNDNLAGLEVDVTKISGSLIVESSSGRIVGNFNTFFDNADAQTTKKVDDVGGGTANVGPRIE